MEDIHKRDYDGDDNNCCDGCCCDCDEDYWGDGYPEHNDDEKCKDDKRDDNSHKDSRKDSQQPSHSIKQTASNKRLSNLVKIDKILYKLIGDNTFDPQDPAYLNAIKQSGIRKVDDNNKESDEYGYHLK